jgi:hypothetical protein
MTRMTRWRWAVVLVTSLCTTSLCTACAGAPAVLTLPDGTAGSCMSVAVGGPEPYWFGIPVTNATDRVVVLEQVQLAASEGLELRDAVVIPPLQAEDGGTLGIGVVRDPANTEPEVWAGRQQLTGFRLRPGQHVDVAVALTRGPGVKTGDAQEQVISYHVDGEGASQRETSRYAITLTDDCHVQPG